VKHKFIVPIRLFISAVLIAFAFGATAEPNRQGAPPSKGAATKIPVLAMAEVETACIDCDERFGIKTHAEILEGLVENKYVKTLRKALYFQDLVHQTASHAHFDNCDFEGSLKYIDSRVALAESQVNLSMRTGGATTEREIAEAFFALGQALHAIQDFYAHSNYVELVARKANRLTDLQILPVWKEQGKVELRGLVSNGGLVSGRVWWGSPKHCPASVPTHGDLAKDSAVNAGAFVFETIKEKPDAHTVARFLAKRASVEFMRFAFERFPALREASGPAIAFEVMLDQRTKHKSEGR